VRIKSLDTREPPFAKISAGSSTAQKQKEDIYCTASRKIISIRNEYLSDDREKRICTSLSIADRFTHSNIPKIETSIFHLTGLIAGEFQEDLIEILAEKSMVAVDVQGFFRNSENRNMVFKDWKSKAKYLPFINFLKTDAAKTEVMTGYSDRKEAAKVIFNLGAKEVMITHNTEVLIYDGKNFYTQPFKPRNLSGRTGRGDTCFSAYITERLKKAVPDSLLYAAALTSLKMETPGPFKGSRESVVDYIKEFYQ